MLTFNIAAVREVIERGFPMRRQNGGFRDPQCGMSAIDNRKRLAFWLVGDHGVYLCFERRSRRRTPSRSWLMRRYATSPADDCLRSNAGRSRVMMCRFPRAKP